MIDLENIEGFDWDDGNLHKNLIKHKVSASECEEVFYTEPKFFAEDGRHSISEKRFILLSRTLAGRKLITIFTKRENKIRVISSRDMNLRERNFYEKI
jgi:uncharacterized DUF497 family protein